jgi:hypothetical protein
MCALALMAVFATATPAKAQWLNSLSELRTARDYLQYDKGGPYAHDKQFAVDEINKAIAEVKHAAWDDGTNTKFAPPAQGVTTGWAPIHQADNWLNLAKGHFPQPDSPQNADVRARAIHHVDLARNTLVHLINSGAQ